MVKKVVRQKEHEYYSLLNLTVALYVAGVFVGIDVVKGMVFGMIGVRETALNIIIFVLIFLMIHLNSIKVHKKYVKR
jgi:hypothetical protein